MADWGPDADRPRLECIHVGSAELRRGDRVRICPRGRADAFDLVLMGKAATIEAIEQDFEDRFWLAVTVGDDPGRGDHRAAGTGTGGLSHVGTNRRSVAQYRRGPPDAGRKHFVVA
jgi:hypothetical protein